MPLFLGDPSVVRGLTPQPHLSPVPREPVPSSIDESKPIYYNKLHLPLPTPAPPQQPALPHFLVAVPHPVQSQLSYTGRG